MPEMRGGDRFSQIDATDATDAANSQGDAGCAIRVSESNRNVPANWYPFGLAHFSPHRVLLFSCLLLSPLHMVVWLSRRHKTAFH